MNGTALESAVDTGLLSAHAAERLDKILYPSDSFTRDKQYWADLPRKQRVRWVNVQNGTEAKRELGIVWRMFKQDPLSPLTAYFRNYVITGLGLFVEGYTLFSVGNLTSLFSVVWPQCWKTHEVCNITWVHATDYLQIVGIILGQACVGLESDWIGRRFGMVQNALIMTLGSVMLTAMWGTSLNGWVICYAWCQFVYGFGVGGEYPIVGTTSMEGQKGKGADVRDRMHRGRRVLLSFLMQGWGQVVNQGLLIVLMLIFHNKLGDRDYNETSTQWTFRVSFGIIAVFTLFLAYLRFYHIKGVDDSIKAAKAKGGASTSGYDLVSLKLAMSHYWHRMLATTLGWAANDFAFYGNKVFSGVFIQIITGSASVRLTWLYNLINVGVSLAGYYLAALLIDNKNYGRKWMQANGFMMLFVLFLIAAVAYEPLTDSKAGVKGFMAIYFLIGFFNQLGSNTTTFLLAGESYPASIRATAHGLSAASGKTGALIPTVVYNYVGSRTKFWLGMSLAIVGWVVTLIFVPDTSGLDLRELERYWSYVRDNRAEDYHGVAVHPQHLSLFERVVLRRHRFYNAELDRQAKMDEMRTAYEAMRMVNGVKYEGSDMSEEQREFLEMELANFFDSERKLRTHDVLASGAAAAHPSKLAALEKKLGQ